MLGKNTAAHHSMRAQPHREETCEEGKEMIRGEREREKRGRGRGRKREEGSSVINRVARL